VSGASARCPLCGQGEEVAQERGQGEAMEVAGYKGPHVHLCQLGQSCFTGLVRLRFPQHILDHLVARRDKEFILVVEGQGKGRAVYLNQVKITAI
jgi:hypothetical protein